MTDDLLKELDAFRHDLQDFKDKWQDDDIWSVLNQAADKLEIDAIRIEKLEAALREIETLELDPRNSGQTWVEALRQIARKALEENNDPST